MNSLEPTQLGLEIFRAPKSDALLAIVVRRSFQGGKYNFLTPNESGMQFGVSNYKTGDVVQPHIHIEIEKVVHDSQECIVIKSGSMQLFVFDTHQQLVAQTRLNAGDVLFQSSGGHAFKALADTQIVEIKQGPFSGDKDKHRFDHPLA